MVIAGIGIAPSLDLPRRGGLQTANGSLSTNISRRRFQHLRCGRHRVLPLPALGKQTRVEHWDNALNQGKQAGRNMAGAHKPYDYMPYFFSDLFEFGYEAVGEVDAQLETFADWQKENDTALSITSRMERSGRNDVQCLGEGGGCTHLDPAGAQVTKKDLQDDKVTCRVDHNEPRCTRLTTEGEVTMKLAEQTARPISKGTPLSRGTRRKSSFGRFPVVTGERAIAREFRLMDFRQAMDFVNSVAAIAHEQDIIRRVHFLQQGAVHPVDA